MWSGGFSLLSVLTDSSSVVRDQLLRPPLHRDPHALIPSSVRSTTNATRSGDSVSPLRTDVVRMICSSGRGNGVQGEDVIADKGEEGNTMGVER